VKTLFAIFLDRRLIDRQGRSGDSSLGLENGAISYETEFWGRPVFALKMMSTMSAIGCAIIVPACFMNSVVGIYFGYHCCCCFGDRVMCFGQWCDGFGL
jgi:hypothetical protein